MPHTEAAAWLREAAEFCPMTADRAAAESYFGDYLAELRSLAMEDDSSFGADLELWSDYVAGENLALLLEQAVDEDSMKLAADWQKRLLGCPPDLLGAFQDFVEACPPLAQEYLLVATFALVRVTRRRRTRVEQWSVERASGSPEMLSQLMFKLGPRFTRFRPG